MDLYFLQYNNYYNRLLKVGSNYLPDYREYIIDTLPNTNFNPNDGVSTTHIAPLSNQEFPDYMLACEGNQIRSRWYVIETARLRTGQYQLTLYRDLLADFYNEIKEAPIFVEKAMLNAADPLIFNQEDMTFNQIRQGPTLLYDKTKCPWIVGYIPADSDLEGKTVSATYNTANTYDIEVENISDWEYASYMENPGYVNTKQYTVFRYTQSVSMPTGYYECNNIELAVSLESYLETVVNEWTPDKDEEFPSRGYYDNNPDFQGTYWYSHSPVFTDYYKKVRTDSDYRSYIDGYFQSKYHILNDAEYGEIEALNGQTLFDSTANSYYKISVKAEQIKDETSLINEQAIVSKLNSFIPDLRSGGSVVNKTYTAKFSAIAISISLEQTQASISVDLSNDRYHLEDQPYDMFCIPYGQIYAFELETGFRTQPIGTALASNIAKELGDNIIYDIQILPYCPVQYAWNDTDHYLDLSKTKYSIIKDSNNKKVSAIVWCRNSNFNFNISVNIPNINDAVEKKIASQTEVYRLVSPNYSSAFQFDPYKNGGVNMIRIDCSYKPFNPYIRLAPVFNELYGYGGDYDSRGLILSGDFSISQLSNAWANYELQNKNYQAMFDRQIQNMEINNKYQRINEIANAATGTVSAALSGAMSGGMMGSIGGPVGMGIGAGAGGAAGMLFSGGAGVADILINEKLRGEALDFTKDQFGYQLGNIQALPTALAKSTAITINNPLIPMLEFYDCSYREKQALRNKIKYNGMTVMAIGTMSEYGPGYFKGKLIRLEGIADDFHIVNAISSELNKGVYL